MVRLALGRPDEEQSREILRRHEHSEPGLGMRPVMDLATICTMQRQVLEVHVSEALRAYIAAIAIETRNQGEVGLPASPRATVAVLRGAQAMALYRGRDHALPDDVKAVAPSVLAHRLAVAGGDASELVAQVLDRVPVPLAV
jgi:MoxR-like ATPase